MQTFVGRVGGFVFSLSLSLGLGLLLISTTANAQGRTVKCESKHQSYHYCRVNTRNRVRLSRRLSSNPCTEGQSWGYDRRGIWVDKGCRAIFEVAYRGGGDGWDHDNDYDNDYRPPRPQHSEVPSWAIGSFTGYNTRANVEIRMHIHDNGKVDGRLSGQPFTGYYDGRRGEIVFGETRLRVDKERRDFSTTEIGGHGDVVHFTRDQ